MAFQQEDGGHIIEFLFQPPAELLCNNNDIQFSIFKRSLKYTYGLNKLKCGNS